MHLSGVAVPARTAASVQVMNMCAELALLGHEVELIAARGTIAAAPFRFYGLEPTFAIMRRPRLDRADLIYARDRRAALLALRAKKPIIFEAHLLPFGLQRAVERRLLASPRVQRLVVHSHALADAYRETFAVLPPIVVAPNGARPDSDAPLPELPPGLRVGYVGSDYPGRGLELVDALGTSIEGADFYVIGRERIVSPYAAEGWRRAMDVLLLPYQERTLTRAGADSTRWMSPLKMFEAMAAGRAIVASDLPALREVLDDSTAILVPPADRPAWEHAIRRLFDPALRSRLGNAARARFLARYTWHARAAKVLEEKIR